VKIEEFDYKLPKELIAMYPVKERSACRLMVIGRPDGSIHHTTFDHITEYFNSGDCLVLNNTKVIPARVFGKRKTGGRVEIFLLNKNGPVCEALVRPSGRLSDGEMITLESGDEVQILTRGETGRIVRFDGHVDSILKKAGHMPLPPYINRQDEESDKSDYQTVYGTEDGATASPTAGLHFTPELLEKIETKGATLAYLTLHTSYGTFAPVKSQTVEEHKMHKEYYKISRETIEVISQCKKKKANVFAVGTTTTRVLEHCASADNAGLTADKAKEGYTDFFIYPGYNFRIVDRLITNFHLPKSTLLLLVAAFMGRELTFKAYEEAIKEKYRFYSYGDAMLIL